MIEELVNFRLAIKKNKPKSEVEQKFIALSNAYENYESKSVIDKMDFRDARYDYYRYMAKSGDGKKK